VVLVVRVRLGLGLGLGLPNPFVPLQVPNPKQSAITVFFNTTLLMESKGIKK
jgi:hypothetical protein